MRIKTSEASGSALDFLVAKCEGHDISGLRKGGVRIVEFDGFGLFSPSKWWRDGGPIIEREGIGTVFQDGEWIGSICPEGQDINDWDYRFNATGSTPLIAAMRCYVASKLGEEVDIPDELTELGE